MSAKIYVGAGHSDSDPGAVSGKLREAWLAEALRNKVAAAIKAAGVEVLTDGDQDKNLPLQTALTLAKTVKGPRVEIHFNAGPPTARGIEALCIVTHRRLAQDLCVAIGAHTGSPLRGDQGWKVASAGKHHRLAFCEIDGVVLEVEFITSAAGMAAYMSKVDAIAESLARVLIDAVKDDQV